MLHYCSSITTENISSLWLRQVVAKNERSHTHNCVVRHTDERPVTNRSQQRAKGHEDGVGHKDGWRYILSTILTRNFCNYLLKVLYHFNQFGRHASQRALHMTFYPRFIFFSIYLIFFFKKKKKKDEL